MHTSQLRAAEASTSDTADTPESPRLLLHSRATFALLDSKPGNSTLTDPPLLLGIQAQVCHRKPCAESPMKSCVLKACSVDPFCRVKWLWRSAICASNSRERCPEQQTSLCLSTDCSSCGRCMGSPDRLPGTWKLHSWCALTLHACTNSNFALPSKVSGEL